MTTSNAAPMVSVPVELVRSLVREIERNTCAHDETHRGGVLWEICDSCGARWADDRGGKPEFSWSPAVEQAREYLAAPAPQPMHGEADDLAPGVPRPWSPGVSGDFEILDANGDPICRFYGPVNDANQAIDITVQAVNAYTQPPAPAVGDDLAPSVPRPWRRCDKKRDELLDANGDPIGHFYGPGADQEQAMALILQAVNATPAVQIAAPGDVERLVARARKAADALVNWRDEMPKVWYGNDRLMEGATVIDNLIAALRSQGQADAVDDATCNAVYDAVTRANFTRDVKTPERKAEIVRAALDAAWPGMVADAERYRWIRKHCDVIEACDETILGWIFQNNGASKLDDWIARRKAMEASRG